MRLLSLSVLCLLATLSASWAQTNEAVIHMLVPGFVVEELPVKLSNQNNLRFSPDGSLTSLGYDGKIWRLRDTNGDGLEDKAESYWDKPTLSVPLGMAWSTHGLFVSSKGKVSLLKDTNNDGVADVEEPIASGWPATDVGSGGVDATAVTLDEQGNVYFGLLVADYSNAYRLRKRKDLKPAEIEWLKSNGRWQEPSSGGGADDEFSLYDLNSKRGTIQKWDPRTKQLTTMATGIRVPVALAFNKAGYLFNTDQEGETWMPDGNPLDELNHIIAGRNYGFPPPHEKWLPNIKSEPAVIGLGPQHQSLCGLVFNEPRTARKLAPGAIALPITAEQGIFGPKAWEGDALLAAESRGKIVRVQLNKTGDSYIASAQTIARLSMLTVDLAISPKGDLYVCTHSGPPDWGTGPQGAGKIFRIRYKDSQSPIPFVAWPHTATEVAVAFDKPLHSDTPQAVMRANPKLIFGEYVRAGDQYEVLKPPYAVVQQQDAAPRGQLAVRSARLEDGGTTLILTTDPHPLAVHYALIIPGIKAAGQSGEGVTIEIDYDLTQGSQPWNRNALTLEARSKLVSWAPKARASGGTDSRAPKKPDGDWETGRSLFFGKELQCGQCHRVRGEGGLAGPDLSNLIHRDVASVLRDIREPNATIHPDYITHQIELKNGENIQGFIRSQKEDSIQIFDALGKETLIPRSDVASSAPTELSLMPSGLLDNRSTNQVRDLLTFLLWEPPQRSKDSIKGLLAKSSPPTTSKPLNMVLVASKQDHGPGQHDYPAWQTNWAPALRDAGLKLSSSTAWEWPSQEQFDSASVIIFYFWNHNWSDERYKQLDAYLERGGGVALIHSATIADREPQKLALRMGLSAHPGISYRHMPFDLQVVDRKHPITRGMPEWIHLLDEPYWPLTGNLADVKVLASAKVDGESRPLIWTKESGKGRVFASIPGHYTWSLNDPLFRLFLLRGIAWAAGEDPARLESR